MPGPWEKYSQQPQASPWAKYAQPAAAPAENPAMAPAEPAIAPKKSGFLANYVGATAEPILQMGTGAITAPFAGIAGVAGTLLPGEQGQGARWTEAVQSLAYQPRTDAGKAVSGAINYPFEKLAQGADYLGQKTADLTGSPLAGTAVNTAIQGAPAALLKGRGKPAVVPQNVPRATPVGPGAAARPSAAETPPAAAAGRQPGLARVPDAAPSKEALKKASQDAYKRAEQAGAVISEESFGRAQKSITSMVEREGLDPTLHPSTTAAIKRIAETKGPLTLEKLETLRRIAKDAEGAIAPADKRLAAKIVDHIDRYADTISSRDLTAGSPEAVVALKEARGLYSRARKADTLDELMERAEISAPNFSGSGMENAIRTEFRNLAKNPRRMRLFNPEERAAIKKVAQGGKVENALRMLGKFAPTGTVSGVLSGGAGFMAGGPLGAVALPAAGMAARYGATRMTLKNAQAANELVRRGPPKKASAPRRNAMQEVN